MTQIDSEHFTALVQKSPINTQLLNDAIDNFTSPNFIFGSDIEFWIKPLKPLKDPQLVRVECNAALDAYSQRSGDKQWVQKTKSVLERLDDSYMTMIELQGLQAPDEHFLIKGELSDIIEYRFGSQKCGLGWRDDYRTFEIRTKPLLPQEFIAAWERIHEALEKRQASLFHNHLHVSAWEGKPFEGGRNIFDMATKEDRLKTKGAVAALAYANSDRAAPFRDWGIRTALGRIELRCISHLQNVDELKKHVIKIMHDVAYGCAHPKAAHFPKTVLNWRPFFSFPDNPELQLALNQQPFVKGCYASFHDDWKGVDIANTEPENDIFYLAGASKENGLPLHNVYISAEKKDNKVIIHVNYYNDHSATSRESKDYEKEYFPKRYWHMVEACKVLEARLNGHARPVFSVSTSGECWQRDNHQYEIKSRRFEENPAYKTMPRELYMRLLAELRQKAAARS